MNDRERMAWELFVSMAAQGDCPPDRELARLAFQGVAAFEKVREAIRFGLDDEEEESH